MIRHVDTPHPLANRRLWAWALLTNLTVWPLLDALLCLGGK